MRIASEPHAKILLIDDNHDGLLVRRALLENVFPVEVDARDAAGARRALERMMAVPRDR